jgi:SAM-dependent methyltransferase
MPSLLSEVGRLKRHFERKIRLRLAGQSWITERFADPAAHEGMLLDTQRCEAYREALRRCVRPGDVVVDLGAGTGLLSFFAAQAGASRVYAIEMSAIADLAARLIEANDFGDRITLVRDKSTRARLPERGDLLVTETLSILGFENENIVEFVADARRRLLKPDARIMPASADTFLVPIQSDDLGIGKLPARLYGLDFSALRHTRYSPQAVRLEASGKAIVELAEPVARWHLDFTAELKGPGPTTFDFVIVREGRLDGFLGWFEATLCPGVTVSNSYRLPPTSWGQAYFPAREQPAVRTGQRLRLEINPGLIAGFPHWHYRVVIE